MGKRQDIANKRYFLNEDIRHALQSINGLDEIGKFARLEASDYRELNQAIDSAWVRY